MPLFKQRAVQTGGTPVAATAEADPPVGGRVTNSFQEGLSAAVSAVMSVVVPSGNGGGSEGRGDGGTLSAGGGVQGSGSTEATGKGPARRLLDVILEAAAAAEELSPKLSSEDKGGATGSVVPLGTSPTSAGTENAEHFAVALLAVVKVG